MSMTPPSVTDRFGRRHALVLSGGGAAGAFEVGVLKALVDGKSPSTGHWGLRSNIFSGASIGAYNCTALASRAHNGNLQPAVDDLLRIWRRQIGYSAAQPNSGLYRLRGFPQCHGLSLGGLGPVECLLQLAGTVAFWSRYLSRETYRFLKSRKTLSERILGTLQLDAFFDIEPFKRLVAETIDIGTLRQRTSFLAVNVTDFRQGTPVVFLKEDITSLYGITSLYASAATPGLVPIVWLGDQPLVDGGVSMMSPVWPAMLAGADVIHLIYTAVPVAMEYLPSHASTYQILYRLTRILLVSNVFNNLQSVHALSDQLDNLVSLAAQGKLAPAVRSHPFKASPLELTLVDTTMSSLRRRDLVIHKYRPSVPIGGPLGFIDFARAHIDRLMALGYEDAEQHDCELAGCLTPETSRLSAERVSS